MVEGKTYTIVSMSPLPESFIEGLFSPLRDKIPGGLRVVAVFGKPRDEVLKALEEADVVIGDYSFQVKIDREMCSHMKKVKLIQQPSTGFDHIDIEACREKGIPVANAGGSNSLSVAEYTIMAALALLKRLLYAHKHTAMGEWPQWRLMELGTYDLYGKTWGIIGMGRIGREVAKRAKAFGVDVQYYDVRRLDPEEEEKLGVKYSRLSRLLRTSDIVSIHVPLTPETRHFIGEEELRSMKPGAILVNPSRGELVDEEALAKALREGWIGGAAVDVYSREPPSPEHPLIKLAGEENYNIIVTPHIAGANTDARARIISHSVQNIVRVLLGEKPIAVVNM
ncbi:MAG: 2-hydroxyacid dehydrogenase [Desulfurococcales archaeon]|nr:2-hydroxyacid dehydrogenase [Desulfurococcales archaeon]